MRSLTSIFEPMTEPVVLEGDQRIELRHARLCVEMECGAISTSETCPACASSTTSLIRILNRIPHHDSKKAKSPRLFRLAATA
jgi:hypothetical protein